jgi:hypothetical protein
MNSLRESIRGDPLEGVYQVAEKWPSAAFPSSLVVAAYSGRERIYAFPTGNFGALHLPACRSFGVGRALFEQPGKNDFFRRLLDGFDALHFWNLLL